MLVCRHCHPTTSTKVIFFGDVNHRFCADYARKPASPPAQSHLRHPCCHNVTRTDNNANRHRRLQEVADNRRSTTGSVAASDRQNVIAPAAEQHIAPNRPLSVSQIVQPACSVSSPAPPSASIACRTLPCIVNRHRQYNVSLHMAEQVVLSAPPCK